MEGRRVWRGGECGGKESVEERRVQRRERGRQVMSTGRSEGRRKGREERGRGEERKERGKERGKVEEREKRGGHKSRVVECIYSLCILYPEGVNAWEVATVQFFQLIMADRQHLLHEDTVKTSIIVSPLSLHPMYSTYR